MKICKSDKLKKKAELPEGVKIFVFKPKPFSLFPRSGHTHTMTINQRIRFLLMLKNNYKVYVLTTNQNDVIGTATYSIGKNKRYPFLENNDLILGPYLVLPEYRNKGYGKLLIEETIKFYKSQEYNRIFAHVWYTNKPSISLLQKNGFKRIGNYSVTRFTRRLIKNANGRIVLMERDLND